MKKILYSLIFIWVWSNSAIAELGSDTFIQYQGGKIVLFALPGCSMDGGKSYNLYGLLEYPNGKHEGVCWNFSNEIISVYFLDESVKQFPPNFVEVEGNQKTDTDSSQSIKG